MKENIVMNPNMILLNTNKDVKQVIISGDNLEIKIITYNSYEMQDISNSRINKDNRPLPEPEPIQPYIEPSVNKDEFRKALISILLPILTFAVLITFVVYGVIPFLAY